MKSEFYIHRFDNGLTLLAEPMSYVVSAAANLAVPVGAAHDGEALAGAAGVLSEWMFRGAAGRDSRSLNDQLDSLGCHHDVHVHSRLMQLSFTQTHQKLIESMGVFADVVGRPNLAAETFEPCRDLGLQDLASLEDQPARKCNTRLRERFFPHPLGAPTSGTREALLGMTDDALREHARLRLTPKGSILSVAGCFDWSELRDQVERIYGSWAGPAPAEPTVGAAEGGHVREAKDTAQMQIALAYAAPTAVDDHYYASRVAEMILSGGMSGRLFTEVREKRGLVYTVGARYRAMPERGGVFVYAGTTPDKAQETLEVTVGELKRLAEGVSEQEVATARTQLKAALIMQGESTAARAGGLINDWVMLGRLRSLEEIAEAIDAVTVADVQACMEAWPARDFTAYFVGPAELDLGCMA